MFKVTSRFVLPDGTIVDKLTPEQQEAWEQKLMDIAAPLAYEKMMAELNKAVQEQKELA